MWPPGARKSDGFAAWPSVATLTIITGLSERTVQTALRELEAAGAIRCIRRSRGGGSHKPGQTRGTNCYLLTPHDVPREVAETSFSPQPMHPGSDVTPHLLHPKERFTPQERAEHLASFAPPPRTRCTPSPALPAPKEFNLNHHHHQEEEGKEEFNARALPDSSPDDDDRRVNRRAPLEDSVEELALRFRERFGSGANAILRIVLDGLSLEQKEVQAFVAFDDAHTGAPEDLNNPGGYYRSLVMKFQLAQKNRRELQRLDKQRELERQLSAPAQPTPPCPLSRCNGMGEVYDTSGRVVTVCECDAGSRLSPQVIQMIDQLKRGAA